MPEDKGSIASLSECAEYFFSSIAIILHGLAPVTKFLRKLMHLYLPKT